MALYTVLGYGHLPDSSVQGIGAPNWTIHGLNTIFEEILPLTEKFEFSSLVNANSHQIACDYGNNGFYVYTGSQEFWKFNVSARSWSKLKSENAPMHSCGLINLGLNSKTGHCQLLVLTDTSKDPYIYDVHDEKWSRLMTTGQIPSEKHAFVDEDGDKDYDPGHRSIAKCHNDLYLTTGFRYMPNGRMELHRLNLNTLVWEALSDQNTKDAPLGRRSYRIVIDEDEKIYVFGGEDREKMCELTHVYHFDTKSRRWDNQLQLPHNGSESAKMGYPESRVDFPCIIHKDCVYILPDHGKNDMWRLHLPSGQWMKFECPLPYAKSRYAADVDRDGMLYVFGGYTEENGTPHLVWNARLIVQPLKRLAWNGVLKFGAHNLVKMTSDELGKLSLPDWCMIWMKW